MNFGFSFNTCLRNSLTMNKKIKIYFIVTALLLIFNQCTKEPVRVRIIKNFGKNWKFNPGDMPGSNKTDFDDSNWRTLDVPHDWSIEGEFSNDHPATPGGGALPGGIGWYRKTFTLPESEKDKLVFINFDGIYQNSKIWINGNYLGERPYGYISFTYELTPFLNYGAKQNILTVKVDNTEQPNSRWYSGSGIYRNVWLVTTGKVHINHWGTYITTPDISEESATVSVKLKIRNSSKKDMPVTVRTVIYNKSGKKSAKVTSVAYISGDSVNELSQTLTINDPVLWSVEDPYLYKAVSQISSNGELTDDYVTTFGIRYFNFAKDKGFSLNGKKVKIKGVCNHHDLGCLGSAVNIRAMERQLEIMKNMGCNSIRTSHNPPAPELLDLCDKMGFLVMDEAFDMWKKKKTRFDYHLHWDEWGKQDLKDFIIRDRNHPSVIMWSIGNEIMEQWDSTGVEMARELTAIVKSLDSTRPVTSGCNDPGPSNNIIKSGALDIIGYNYKHLRFTDFQEDYSGQIFIASETTSALATRGHYDMPSDSIRIWPKRWDLPLLTGNPDNTCSAYDNCHVPWGSTHEEVWEIIKKHDYLSGMYVWTGFDYLGEPTPYDWPSRSSYFGIVDLAGFPKDAYYFYQSEWTDKDVLHIFPHWNWEQGDTIDIWAYTNLDEVELFLNDESLGVRYNSDSIFHLVWRVPYVPGVLKATGRKGENTVLEKEVKTAGPPSSIRLIPDRKIINADGSDLCFITVKVVDANDILVPRADNLIKFQLIGNGTIVGVDNGCQTSHEPFKADYRKAFNGMCLAVIRSGEEKGTIKVKATSEGLEESEVVIETK
jgi:beta-galactosidase